MSNALNSARVRFFATAADLMTGLQRVEAPLDLRYVSLEARAAPDITAYDSALAIPNFGNISGRRSPQFLIVPRGQVVTARRIVEIPKYGTSWWQVRPGWRRDCAVALACVGLKLPGGSIRYEPRAPLFGGSVLFAPGGLADENTLVAGELALPRRALKSRHSLFQQLKRNLLSNFDRIKDFHVGPEARALLDRGGRLTIDLEASPSIDLKQ